MKELKEAIALRRKAKILRFWPSSRRVDPGELRTGNRTTGSCLSLGFVRRGGRENSRVLGFDVASQQEAIN